MKWKSNTRYLNIGLVVILTLSLLMAAGCSSKTAVEAPVKTVKTMAINKSDMTQSEAFAGKLRAAQEVFISPKISGRVASVKFEIGDAVRKGDILFDLENDEIKAQQFQAQSGLNQAQANLALTQNYSTSQQLLQAKQLNETAMLQFNDAKSLLDKYKSLYESGAISKKQLDDATLGYNTAKLSLEKSTQSLKILESSGAPQSVSISQAQVNSSKAAVELNNLQLENSEIKAPIDGFVSMKNLEAGELVSAGSPVLAVVDSSYMEAELEVPAKTVLNLKKGDKVNTNIKLVPVTKQGAISAISPAADIKSGLYTVKIRIENSDQILKQGMIADISFTLDTRKDVLAVPNQAILVEDGIEYIFINDNGTARKKSVKSGISDEKFTQVIDSLAEGEEVVIEGQNFLNDGDKIKT